MSFIKAKEELKKYGLDSHIMEFESSSATVLEAAHVIGCTEGEIAKTMSFLVGENPILIVVAGDKKIDNHKYKEFFHAKAKMVEHDKVNEMIGHEVGGVCPFGVKEGITIYLDNSLKQYETIYPACGSTTSAVKLTIPELEQASHYKEWIDVCK